MAYSRNDKDRIYREWASQGFPPLWPFTQWLDKQVTEKNEEFAWLEKAPTDVTLKTWYKEEEWDRRAIEEQNKIREALTQDAVQVKEEMFRKLKASALAKLEAQDQIFKAAKLEELEPEDARRLLEAAQEMGRSGTRDMQEALLLIGEPARGHTNKPALEGVMNNLDQLLSGAGKELKLAMAAQLTSKDDNVVEGSFKELPKGKDKFED